LTALKGVRELYPADVAVYFKNFPLSSNPDSQTAAQAALAAHRQASSMPCTRRCSSTMIEELGGRGPMMVALPRGSEEDAGGMGDPGWARRTRWLAIVVLLHTRCGSDEAPGSAADNIDAGPAMCGPCEDVQVRTRMLPDAHVARPYEQSISAAGGCAPLEWTVVDGSLPDGLTLAPQSGSIAGMPTTIGTSSATVRVSDSCGHAALRAVTLAVRDHLVPVRVAAGAAHSLALLSDGRVAAWGSNQLGQVGNDSTEDALAPVLVGEIHSAIAVAAGEYYSVALLSDGTLLSWGYAAVLPPPGGLQGWTAPRPVVHAEAEDMVEISAGNAHALARRAAGDAIGIGWSVYLGDGELVETDGHPEVALYTGRQVTSVAAGDMHSLMALASGEVVAWGDNFHGQLGDGTQEPRAHEVAVQGLGGVTQVAVGLSHSLARDLDGRVHAWGWNLAGALGSGTTLDERAPALVEGIATAVRVDAGWYHSLALLEDGTVLSWGNADDGQLGREIVYDPMTVTSTAWSPGAVLDGALDVAAGGDHTLVVLTDGRVVSFGENALGQLGTGDTENRALPAEVLAAW
jgi:alpha-tubulin suppressor-like RCC1 family protein